MEISIIEDSIDLSKELRLEGTFFLRQHLTTILTINEVNDILGKIFLILNKAYIKANRPFTPIFYVLEDSIVITRIHPNKTELTVTVCSIKNHKGFSDE